jgi:hypothetical protein
MKSLVFTLRNPHSFRARRFALNREGKGWAIYRRPKRGPNFNDIWFCENCNASSNNYTSLGPTYTNDTGLEGQLFFTGLVRFQVKEIEVFQITA